MADPCLHDVQLGGAPVINVAHATQGSLQAIKDLYFDVAHAGESHLACVHGKVEGSQLSNSAVYDTQVAGGAMEFQIADTIMYHLQGIHFIEPAKR